MRSVLGFQTWSEHRIPHFLPNCFLVLRRVEKEISWGQLQKRVSLSFETIIFIFFGACGLRPFFIIRWGAQRRRRMIINEDHPAKHRQYFGPGNHNFPVNVQCEISIATARATVFARDEIQSSYDEVKRAQTSKRLMKYDTRRRKERWMGRYRSFECHRNESEPPFKVRTSDILFECSRNNVNRSIGRRRAIESPQKQLWWMSWLLNGDGGERWIADQKRDIQAHFYYYYVLWILSKNFHISGFLSPVSWTSTAVEFTRRRKWREGNQEKMNDESSRARFKRWDSAILFFSPPARAFEFSLNNISVFFRRWCCELQRSWMAVPTHAFFRFFSRIVVALSSMTWMTS